jgi:P27 family predicted phage terminase small subunit
MAIRGRPPKSSKLRALEGNPGKRPLNEREPQPTGPLVKPDFVTGEAASEWDRVVGAMPPGLYTAADAPVLAVYCVAWVLFRNSLAQVAREGMTATGSMGQKIAHPSLATVAKQSEIILRASDRLGMSPVARARLEVGDQPQASKFDGLLGGAQLRLVTTNEPKGSARSSKPSRSPAA